MNVIECYSVMSLQEPRLDKLGGQTLSKKCTVGTGQKKIINLIEDYRTGHLGTSRSKSSRPLGGIGRIFQKGTQ